MGSTEGLAKVGPKVGPWPKLRALPTIGKVPTAINHWRKEVGGFLDQVEALSEHSGGRTCAEYRVMIIELRSRLLGLLGDEP